MAARSLLLLFSLSGAPEVNLWTSQMITSWTNRASLDAVCASESSGGIALVCTLAKNVSEYFSEAFDVVTADSAGGWNTANPVALAGSVRQTMFSGSTTNLRTNIVSIMGAPTGLDGISTGCDPYGGIIPPFACGGSSYAFPNGVVSSNGRAATDSTWLQCCSGVACNISFRVYCIVVPPTPPPTPPSSAPTPPPTPPSSAPPSSAPSTGVQPLPTSAPSFRPTQAPTRVPTAAPTCATCTATLTPGSNSSNTTVTVGDPSSPVTVFVPPSAIPNCTKNCSVQIVVFPTSSPSSSPSPSPPFAGGSIVSIDVYDSGTPRDEVTLNIPIVFTIPYSSSLAGCTGAIEANCMWRNGSSWLPSGCASEALPTGTQCTCNHLTDFAVLLDLSFPHPCQPTLKIPEIYFVFIALYSLVLLYCVVVFSGLIKARSAKDSHGALLLQHGLIGIVAALRVLSCLAYLEVFGVSIVLTAFVAAAPYPLEYLLFTKLASTWAGLAHFAMLSADARWVKIRPLFFTLNFLGTGVALALFVVFVLEESFEAALGGTCVLAFLYLALAIAFHVYAFKILRELDKGSAGASGSSAGSSKKAVSGVVRKIRWVARSATASFVAQAICSVLAMVLASDQLAGWTAAFLFFNVLALACLLAAYYAAVKKVLSNDNFSKSGPSQSSELTDLRKREG